MGYDAYQIAQYGEKYVYERLANSRDVHENINEQKFKQVGEVKCKPNQYRHESHVTWGKISTVMSDIETNKESMWANICNVSTISNKRITNGNKVNNLTNKRIKKENKVNNSTNKQITNVNKVNNSTNKRITNVNTAQYSTNKRKTNVNKVDKSRAPRDVEIRTKQKVHRN